MDNIKEVTRTINRKCKPLYFLKIVTSIVYSGILLVTPLLLSYSIDAVSIGDYSKGIFYIILSILAILIYRIAEYFNLLVYYNLYNKLFHEYNIVSLKSTFQNSLFSLSRFTAGSYNNIVDDDVNVISTYYSDLVLRIVQLLQVFIVYYYFYQLNIYIFAATIVVSIIILIYVYINEKSIFKTSKLYRKTVDARKNHTLDFFNGIKEIKTFNIFEIISRKNLEAFKDSYKANTKYSMRYSVVNIISLLFIELFRYSIFIYGILLVRDNVFEIGVLLVIYNYYQKIIDSYTTLLSMNTDRINLGVSLNRFNKILEHANPSSGEKHIEYEEFKGSIEFNNVLYGYRDDPTLKDISFKITPNTITVITGKEGFGKIGIFDLLMRFNHQHEGNIKVDDIDINDIRENDYFKLISMSSQKPVFFNDTIKNNLLMIDPDEYRIEKILKELRIDKNVLELKNKMDTVMNKEKSNLTSNLLDMLSIARVIIKDSKIMLFDESISSLEKNKQKYVLNYLNELKKSHTILIISREKNIINIADNIIEINGNELDFFGPLSKYKRTN